MIRVGGLLLICLVVFGTTGLFFCFFIPTGAFLFTAGIFTATGGLAYNIFTVCILLVLSSVLGNFTGYWFGRKTGPLLYKRKDTRFFKKQHLTTAKAFYEKYGFMALTLGLYLPIIRTFSPIVAGIVVLDFRKFSFLTFIGSVLWIFSFVMAGYGIGRLPFLKSWINYIVLVFILVVTVPLIIWVIKELRRMKNDSSINSDI
jgi:membrane-associated protein